jgi:hypothetical protein
MERLEDRTLPSVTWQQLFVADVYNTEFAVNGKAVPPNAADTALMAQQTAALLPGISTRDVAATMLQSQSFQRDEIRNLYVTYAGFDDAAVDPTEAGVNFWLSLLAQGSTMDSVREDFLSSDVFFNLKAGSNNAWVTALYLDVWGQQADPAGVLQWTNALNNGTSRNAVATAFVTDPRAYTLQINQDYCTVLNHFPDPASLNFFNHMRQQGGTNEQILADLHGSTELFGHIQFFLQPGSATLPANAPPNPCPSPPMLSSVTNAIDAQDVAFRSQLWAQIQQQMAAEQQALSDENQARIDAVGSAPADTNGETDDPPPVNPGDKEVDQTITVGQTITVQTQTIFVPNPDADASAAADKSAADAAANAVLAIARLGINDPTDAKTARDYAKTHAANALAISADAQQAAGNALGGAMYLLHNAELTSVAIQALNQAISFAQAAAQSATAARTDATVAQEAYDSVAGLAGPVGDAQDSANSANNSAALAMDASSGTGTDPVTTGPDLGTVAYVQQAITYSNAANTAVNNAPKYDPNSQAGQWKAAAIAERNAAISALNEVKDLDEEIYVAAKGQHPATGLAVDAAMDAINAQADATQAEQDYQNATTQASSILTTFETIYGLDPANPFAILQFDFALLVALEFELLNAQDSPAAIAIRGLANDAANLSNDAMTKANQALADESLAASRVQDALNAMKKVTEYLRNAANAAQPGPGTPSNPVGVDDPGTARGGLHRT